MFPIAHHLTETLVLSSSFFFSQYTLFFVYFWLVPINNDVFKEEEEKNIRSEQVHETSIFLSSIANKDRDQLLSAP